MRSARFGLLLFFFLFNISVWAQQPAASQQAASAQPASDPQAVVVVQAAITALGGATAIGQAQSWTFQAQTQGPIASGEMSETITSATRTSAGTTIKAPRHSPSRVEVSSLFVPAVLGAILLKQSQDQNVSMQYGGTTALGSSATVTAVTFTMTKHANYVAQMWYFDSATGLPARVEFRVPSWVGSTDGFAGTVELSDFRPVAGVVYPFHLEIRIDGWVQTQVVDIQSLKSGV